MLLAVDAGNTNILVGVYNGDKLETTFRITTKISRTADEFGLDICNLIEMAGLDWHDIDAAVIASVVPDIMHSLTQAIKGYMKVDSLIIDSKTETGITVKIPNPAEMGPDRIADAAAAYAIYGGPVLIVDFGTATTYGIVTEKGDLTGVAISPGVRIVSEALTTNAAKLPRVELSFPKSVIGRNTEQSMQAGILYGYVGEIEYIVRKIKSEIGDAKVIATGGFAQIFAEKTDVIDKVVPTLTLMGLNRIYEKNCKGE